MSLRIKTLSALALALLFTSSAATQTHDHSAMSTTSDGQFNPYVVSDNRGGFYFAYVERKNGLSNVMLQHSPQGGAFSPAVRVNSRAGDGAVRNENPPKMAMGRKNEVYVVWASERERWKGNIRFARSLNGGKTFEPAIDVNSGVSQRPIGRAFQSIAVDAKGRIFVVWIDERNKTAASRGGEIWMAVSTDQGKTFSPDRKILADVCECCRTSIAVDSAGRIFVSYRVVPSSGPMLRDIAIARSDDEGKTFNPSLVNRDGWDINACPIAGATMTIDSSDRLHVAWFTQSGETPRLFFASSTNHGASFTKPAVFDRSQKLAKHAHVVSLSGNRVLIAWDDQNTASFVSWGVFDVSTKSLNMLGTRRQSSYPIIASSGNKIAVVALQPNQAEFFRVIQTSNASK